MPFAVSVLDRAQKDADRIFLWIAERSTDGAIRWEKAYEDALLGLRHNANWQSRAPESDELGIEVRKKVFKTRRGRPYTLIYTIAGNQVRVLRVRGPGQAPVTAEDIAE